MAKSTSRFVIVLVSSCSVTPAVVPYVGKRALAHPPPDDNGGGLATAGVYVPDVGSTPVPLGAGDPAVGVDGELVPNFFAGVVAAAAAPAVIHPYFCLPVPPMARLAASSIIRLRVSSFIVRAVTPGPISFCRFRFFPVAESSSAFSDVATNPFSRRSRLSRRIRASSSRPTRSKAVSCFWTSLRMIVDHMGVAPSEYIPGARDIVEEDR